MGRGRTSWRAASGCALGLVALALANAGGAGAAAGGERRVVTETKVTIKISVPLYHGRVKSVYDECVDGRKVFLFRKRPGPNERIGMDRASDSGRWRVQHPNDLAPGDRFYAKVRNVEFETGGTGLSCIRDKSRTVTFVGD